MALSLKALRVNAEMTRPAVLKRLQEEHNIKLSKNTLASYENKQTTPDIITAKALASIYGASIDDIIFL